MGGGRPPSKQLQIVGVQANFGARAFLTPDKEGETINRRLVGISTFRKLLSLLVEHTNSG